jgi:hypothetical protein
MVEDILMNKPRARDLSIPLEGTPGKMNAITDMTVSGRI